MAVAALLPHGMQTYQIACGAIEGHRARDAEVQALRDKAEVLREENERLYDAAHFALQS